MIVWCASRLDTIPAASSASSSRFRSDHLTRCAGRLAPRAAMVEIEKNYVFECPDGTIGLLDLFQVSP
jgi:predicted dithiol-disulfide oxidoreductase (DUF899 family)